ncbi:response regulator transcription factor [Cryptosporangium aurantiacum]|uniref:DNA-binding response regulator, NarL/FixJ family, contains REC and HTH domains n=1 Tax=Cryptosporangium aurantiacum TaxID=134849 RepID=A0A1M7RDQ9_9ACTN|nr:response regulator transcription factor [Cryptosporangium aurantiacum]SHN44364.1 DNA-binding response regulator, NarL/FixJ family, contains REC and HTH domains [Cryptosporangium aurantiacum]
MRLGSEDSAKAQVIAVTGDPDVMAWIRVVLERSARYAVQKDVATAEDAVTAVTNERPSAVVWDNRVGGLLQLDEVRRASPRPTPVVILVNIEVDAFVAAAAARGVSAFLLSENIRGHLIPALDGALGGVTWVGPGLQSQLRLTARIAGPGRLSSRDIALLEAELDNRPVKQIAKDFGYSVQGIHYRRQAIARKLNIPNNSPSRIKALFEAWRE